jgi:hypothetical protein
MKSYFLLPHGQAEYKESVILRRVSTQFAADFFRKIQLIFLM